MFGRKKPKREIPYETRKRRYNKVTAKYPKTYTVKEWKRFSPDIQQELTNRYNVTISDFKTRKEKMKMVRSKMGKAMTELSKMEMKGGKGVNYLDAPINIKSPNTLGMFDAGFKRKKSKSYFDNLANF